MRRSRIHTLALTVAVLGATTACSSDAIAERALEEVAGAAGDGEVDLDISDEGVRVETSEGTQSFGAGGELPASFPDDLPVPENHEIVSTSEQEQDGETGLIVVMLTPDAFDEVVADLEGRLVDAGWEIGDRASQNSNGLRSLSMQVTQGDVGAFISITGDGDEKVMVSYAVGSAAR